MRRANTITLLVILAGSLYVLWESITMQYTIDGVPGPGFIPLWTAVIMGFISLVGLFNNVIRKKPDSDQDPGFNKGFLRNTFAVIGGSVVSMLLVRVLGMLIAVGLLTGFLSWILGTKSVRTNVLLAVITPVVFWLIFVQGLSVNFPKGLIGF